MNSSSHKLIIALDAKSELETKELVSKISKECVEYRENILFKVNDLVTSIGFKWLKEMFLGVPHKIMLDLKWHDISNTLINNIIQIKNNDLWEQIKYFTLHGSNSKEAIEKAVEKRNNLWIRSKILWITLLTSLGDNNAMEIYGKNSIDTVLSLTKEILEWWADGVVCAPQDIAMVRSVFWYDFEIVTPGVRFEWSERWDQVRIATPKETIESGWNHVVMGRPLLQSDNVITQVQRFFHEIKGVVSKDFQWLNERERLLYNNHKEEFFKDIGVYYTMKKWWKYCRLASGLVSSSYMHTWIFERHPSFLSYFAFDLARNMREQNIECDVVMWAQMGSVRFSYALAQVLWSKQSIYTEKWEGWELFLKRHNIALRWKKVVLNEDVVTKWSTLRKMIQIVESKWWKVVGITCIANRHGKDSFEGIPLLSYYIPPEFELFYDSQTPREARWNYPELPEWSLVSEKPKNELFNWV